MFSKDLEHTIGQCYKRAREARHEFMTVEHLLLALLDNPSAEAVLKAIGADFPRLRHELDKAIETSVAKLADDDGRDTQPTLGFQRVLQRAVYHVQSSGQEGSHRRQRAGRDLRREGFARGLFPQPAGRHAAWTSSTISRTASPAPGEGEESQSAGRGASQGERGRDTRATRSPNSPATSTTSRSPARSTRWSAATTKSSAPSRCCAAAARTIRCTSAKPASARPRSPKGWPSASSKATCPKCWPTR